MPVLCGMCARMYLINTQQQTHFFHCILAYATRSARGDTPSIQNRREEKRRLGLFKYLSTLLRSAFFEWVPSRGYPLHTVLLCCTCVRSKQVLALAPVACPQRTARSPCTPPLCSALKRCQFSVPFFCFVYERRQNCVGVRRYECVCPKEKYVVEFILVCRINTT